MLRLPPKPTLFPYTTLFRSDPEWIAVNGEFTRIHLRAFRSGPISSVAHFQINFPRAGCGRTRKHLADCGPPAGRGRDRKSTRLNSSHSSISYAVFCLKKKIE